jgi:cytochrome c556
MLREMQQSISGWPVGLSNNGLQPQVGGVLRSFSASQCEQIAATSAPIAREIESHRDWLSNNSAASAAFIQAMNHQADYERNMHAGRSLKAMLNLADIYSQQPTIEQSHQTIDQAMRAIEKIRDADVPVPSDTNELTRQHLEIEEQATSLQLNQQQLTQAIELLLELESSEVPLWPDMQDFDQVVSNFGNIETDCESAYQTALTHRGDLKALQILAGDSDRLSTEQFAALADAGSPLLGAGLDLPVSAALWWQCRLKDQFEQRIECIKEKEAARRREQMISLAENKRKQIRREVCDAIDAIKTNQRLLELKTQRRDSLTQSIVAAEKAKDEEPLDFAAHLQNRLERLKLETEITHQHFLIAAEKVRLREAQGLLGQQAQYSNPNSMLYPGTEVLQTTSPVVLQPINAAALHKTSSEFQTSIVSPNAEILPTVGNDSRSVNQTASPAPRITFRK